MISDSELRQTKKYKDAYAWLLSPISQFSWRIDRSQELEIAAIRLALSDAKQKAVFTIGDGLSQDGAMVVINSQRHSYEINEQEWYQSLVEDEPTIKGSFYGYWYQRLVDTEDKKSIYLETIETRQMLKTALMALKDVQSEFPNRAYRLNTFAKMYNADYDVNAIVFQVSRRDH